MSPYQPMPPAIESGYFGTKSHSYPSDYYSDTDSDNAGFANDIDGASFVSEDSAHSPEEKRNAAIDAQHARLFAPLAPKDCDQANDTQSGSRHANSKISPVPFIGARLTCSPPSEWSACSNLDRQGEQYSQQSSTGPADHAPSAKPSHRATMPGTSEQSQYLQEHAAVSTFHNISQESLKRYAANMAWRPQSTIDRRKTVDTLTRIMEHGADVRSDELSKTAGVSDGKPNQSEQFGCEYRVW